MEWLSHDEKTEMVQGYNPVQDMEASVAEYSPHSNEAKSTNSLPTV
jgi:hypothetical protein